MKANTYMSTRHTPYMAQERMRDVVDDNNLLLLVLSRFGIPLGFGDATIESVCRENNVDIATFMAVANVISGHEQPKVGVSVASLMGYLQGSHSYFLDFILPTIREKLIKAINCQDSTDVGFLILKYYDDYVAEVRHHLGFENDTIFPYIRSLLDGNVSDDSISLLDYMENHESMAEKLQELKDIVIRHYRQRDNYILNYVLYDIINLEADLMSHCDIENRLFFPAAMRLEREAKSRPVADTVDEKDRTERMQKIESLSNREKEIIACVAKGMSNKEIAESLFLSVHTVTTHRRNIASKLQIHSSAGLTIFAILHNLIDIKEIKL